MKHAEKLHPSRGASSSSSPPPAHRLSHAIAKGPPPRKVRIIHVLAPEIIKTEARHFRDLVQRLTGKPPTQQKGGSCASSSTAGGDASPSLSPPTSVSSSCDTASGDEGLLGARAAAGLAAGIEAVNVKVEAESSLPLSSPPSGGEEGGGFLRALELDGYGDGFQLGGLDDFLFNPWDMDAVARFNF